MSQKVKIKVKVKIKAKRAAPAPKSAKQPFSKNKSDKWSGAGKKIYPGILATESTQTKRNTGKTLLKSAMKRLARSR